MTLKIILKIALKDWMPYVLQMNVVRRNDAAIKNRSWHHKYAITYIPGSSTYFVLFALWHIPSLPVFHSYRAPQ